MKRLYRSLAVAAEPVVTEHRTQTMYSEKLDRSRDSAASLTWLNVLGKAHIPSGSTRHAICPTGPTFRPRKICCAPQVLSCRTCQSVSNAAFFANNVVPMLHVVFYTLRAQKSKLLKAITVASSSAMLEQARHVNVSTLHNQTGVSCRAKLVSRIARLAIDLVTTKQACTSTIKQGHKIIYMNTYNRNSNTCFICNTVLQFLISGLHKAIHITEHCLCT